jgi:DNA (cytosine-5)-methyltransferase 1
LQASGKAAGSATQQDAESGLLVPVQAFYSTESRCDNIPPEGISPPLKIGSNGGGQPRAVVCPSLTAFNMDSRSPQSEEQQRTVEAVYDATMMVRRLTPRECCRLQGMPDDWTLVTVRGKPAADGGRYKAIGNSMAVPVMAWIGRRVAEKTR